MEKMKNIDQIWFNIMSGKIVFWSNKMYRLTLLNSYCSHQDDHFSNKNGFVLRVTCTSNWFGSLLEESEIEKCFTDETY